MNNKHILTFLYFFVIQSVFAQNDPNVITFESFMRQVSIQHPTALQINLLANRATRELQQAKGQLDPVFQSQYDRKLFNGSNYYDLLNVSMLIPTYYGISAEVGFNHNAGDYINPEDKTPYNGQAYLGLNVNLLQGLITNERNTIIQQAQLLQGSNSEQAKNLLNNLLYEAAYAYWEWAFAYNEVKIWTQAYQLAETRLEATKNAYLYGDKPAMDTLETYSNILDRKLRMYESQLDFMQATIYINNFLWQNNNPVDLPQTAVPVSLTDTVVIDSTFLNKVLASLPDQHPELRLYDYQLQNLNISQKLKNNKLLPKLELKYNLLAYNSANFFENSAFGVAENYKFGVKFSYPILTRQARADVALNQIKIAETKYKLAQKQLELSNKLRNYYVEINNYAQQIVILQNNVKNYELLLSAEYEKFRLGESSIFVLNSREIKLIETQQKLLTVLTKFQKAKASFGWSAATLSIF